MRITFLLVIILFTIESSHSKENSLDLLIKEKDKSIFRELENGEILSTGTKVFSFLELGNDTTGKLIIEHPQEFTLFINNTLYYRSLEKGTIHISFIELANLSQNGSLAFESISPFITNRQLIFSLATQEDENQPQNGIDFHKSDIDNSLIYYLSIFILLAVAIVRFYSRRNFEFYFKGSYLFRPKFWNDKFSGENINLLYVTLGVICLVIFMIGFLGNSSQSFGLDNILPSRLKDLEIIIYVMGIFIAYQAYKVIAYWFHNLLIGDRRQFQNFMSNSILIFTNSAFFLFLIFAIQIFIFRHLESQTFFQIIFFIFAALNAIGSSRVYLKMWRNNTAVTICSMLLIEFIPVISLLKVLS